MVASKATFFCTENCPGDLMEKSKKWMKMPMVFPIYKWRGWFSSNRHVRVGRLEKPHSQWQLWRLKTGSRIIKNKWCKPTVNQGWMACPNWYLWMIFSYYFHTLEHLKDSMMPLHQPTTFFFSGESSNYGILHQKVLLVLLMSLGFPMRSNKKQFTSWKFAGPNARPPRKYLEDHPI